MKVIIRIKNGDKVFEPKVLDGITWSTERKGSPSVLKFNVVKSGELDFTEGNLVNLIVDDVFLFSGFVFSKSRGKGETISVTAYDQLRYLKNKETYLYENMKASEVIKLICNDFGLVYGAIEDTVYKIPSRVEDNKTLFDIVQSALDLTFSNSGILYVLYDDLGQITLKRMDNMKVPILIDNEVAENFQYSSSIDDSTYNRVRMYQNKRIVYEAKDDSNIGKWGVLQLTESIDDNENPKEKAENLLKQFNGKTRGLSIKKIFGDKRVRAGSMVGVKLNLGDIVTEKYMLVEKCTHSFYENEHYMELDLWL